MSIPNSRTVLVVDDALTIRAYHKALLEEIGFAVLEAENGIEAMEKVVEHALHLCLVDVNMPLMDGFTFVRQLRQGDLNTDCPVIMITTESRASEETRGYQAGANLYLVKPADPEHLQTICQLMAVPFDDSGCAPAHAPEADVTPAAAANGGLFDYFNELVSE